MTKLCAEAMGFSPLVAIPTVDNRGIGYMPPQYAYCPLHDDAQAMALIKKFSLRILHTRGSVIEWSVNVSGGWPLGGHAMNADLNRAIIECIARMQVAT